MCEHLFATLDVVSLILNCSIDELLKEVKDIMIVMLKVIQRRRWKIVSNVIDARNQPVRSGAKD